MERTLDELREETAYWKAEVERVKARESDAIGRYYQAEREIKRNKKPTPGQLAILRKLADGAALKEDYRFRGRYLYWWQNGSERGYVSSATYYGILNRELTSFAGKDGSATVNLISDWGREVLAKAARKEK